MYSTVFAKVEKKPSKVGSICTKKSHLDNLIFFKKQAFFKSFKIPILEEAFHLKIYFFS